MTLTRSYSSEWRKNPEEIISHHYKLYAGIRPVIDTSAPVSMYNSPKSIHYIPKRASSADQYKRVHPVSIKSTHRELSDFLANNGRLPNSLRLNLPTVRNPYTARVKSKLLESKDYQAPLHRKVNQIEKVVELPETIPKKPPRPPRRRSSVFQEQMLEKHLLFKDTVYNDIITRGVYTDRIIEDAVDIAAEQFEDEITAVEVEMLRLEIYDDFGVQLTVDQSSTIRKRSLSAQNLNRMHVGFAEAAEVESLEASSARSLASKLDKQNLGSDGDSLPSMQSQSSSNSEKTEQEEPKASKSTSTSSSR
ncbi:unnamed protein product, partial [Mesorhabditis belari]|uniref:Uncharacterized protein n=1 Tax=Mesorhabditis belari TaxID=2138241 RepID=A0AAF3EXK8_9BILA